MNVRNDSLGENAKLGKLVIDICLVFNHDVRRKEKSDPSMKDLTGTPWSGQVYIHGHSLRSLVDGSYEVSRKILAALQ
jgi:hypothetical protein